MILTVNMGIYFIHPGKVVKSRNRFARCFFFFPLRNEIALYMDEYGKALVEIQDQQWINNLAFLVDLSRHLNLIQNFGVEIV